MRVITDNTASVNITVLVDNTAAPPFAEEHGFSALIETDGKKILFDTGQGNAIFKNAAVLGISLTNLDVLVLSHGHYDHTGAVAKLVELNPLMQIFAGCGVLATRFNLKDPAFPKDISVPSKCRSALSALPLERFILLDKPYRISKNCFLTGPIPRNTTFEDVSGAFFFDGAGKYPDSISDEIALFVSTSKGDIILSGCAHSGIVNTVMYVRFLNEKGHIHAVAGGFHLHSVSERRMEMTASFLNISGIDLLVPCHCTGKNTIAYLKENCFYQEIVNSQAGFCLSV